VAVITNDSGDCVLREITL